MDQMQEVQMDHPLVLAMALRTLVEEARIQDQVQIADLVRAVGEVRIAEALVSLPPLTPDQVAVAVARADRALRATLPPPPLPPIVRTVEAPVRMGVRGGHQRVVQTVHFAIL